MAHWAVTAATRGWLAVSFAEVPGQMVPAEAIIGGVTNGARGAGGVDAHASLGFFFAHARTCQLPPPPHTGVPFINTHRLTSYDPFPPANDIGWATNTGAVQLANGTTIICFTTSLPDGNGGTGACGGGGAGALALATSSACACRRKYAALGARGTPRWWKHKPQRACRLLPAPAGRRLAQAQPPRALKADGGAQPWGCLLRARVRVHAQH